MNHLTKNIFLFFFTLVALNITTGPVLARAAGLVFNTFYEYYEELPTDPASLVVIIIPQDFGGKEIYGVSVYYKTDQYQLPTPSYSNFNINFQGWGSGDWSCAIGEKSLVCHGDTALEIGKKTIVAMYFGDNITPPDKVITNVLDINNEVIDVMEIGSILALTNQESSREPKKEEVVASPTIESVTVTQEGQQVQTKKQFEFTSWGSLGAVAATSAIVLSAAYIIRIKKLPRRKRRKKSKSCPTCSGSGKIKIKQESEIVKCPNCKDVSAKRCSYCGGTGKMNEAGQLAAPETSEALGMLPPCDWCKGTGWNKGAIKKMVPGYFTGAACAICKGRGYTVHESKQSEREETCPTCNGKGTVPV